MKPSKAIVILAAIFYVFLLRTFAINIPNPVWAAFSVPEPTSFSVLAIGAVGLLLPRPRRLDWGNESNFRESGVDFAYAKENCRGFSYLAVDWHTARAAAWSASALGFFFADVSRLRGIPFLPSRARGASKSFYFADLFL